MPQSAASFLPRLSLSRGDGPSLPRFNSRRSLRSKPSEYDLAELSPRPEQSLLWPEPAQDQRADRTPSPAAKMKRQVLFVGPPPPIATSTLLYRDEETGAEAPSRYGCPPNHTASLGDTLRSVFLDRPPPEPPREVSSGFDADSVWRNIQRRERAIQKDLQRLLDVQAAGLSAGLGRSLDKSPSLTPSSASDAGRSTPTSTYHTPRSQFHSTESSMRMSRQGDVIPVRQPRSKPMGLRSARAALARNMALLADLKVEEDANLADALSTRKRALAQLRKMSVRRDGIADKLRALENADDDPLTRDLALLNEEHRSVSTEISGLEAKLAGLRNRKRVLEEQIEDLSNQRESGLSGYRGALKEAEEHVAATLTRPPVRPLDLEVFGRGADGAEINGADDAALSGAEFMRLRPMRRTIAMAREWWEGEVRILEQRKAAVDQERAALEDGAEVWRDCVKLVTDFESDLRRQMKQQSTSSEDSDEEAADSPEQRMRGQLSDMGAVIKSLDLHLAAAENKGWNLLICAIGAELEAFKEAESMFREALREAGYSGGPDEEDRTPRLGRSASEIKADRDAMGSQRLVDTRDDGGDDPGAESSDNEVPADLLVSHHDPRGGGARHDSMSGDAATTDSDAHDKGEHSENEVPPEFLAEHQS